MLQLRPGVVKRRRKKKKRHLWSQRQQTSLGSSQHGFITDQGCAEAHLCLCLFVLAQKPIFPGSQELVVKWCHYAGGAGESIHATETGQHCRPELCFLPWRTDCQNICQCRGPVPFITSKILVSVLRGLASCAHMHASPSGWPDLWKQHWIRKKYRRHQMVNVSWWESRGDYCSVTEKTLCNEDGKGTDLNRKLSACLAGEVGSSEAMRRWKGRRAKHCGWQGTVTRVGCPGPQRGSPSTSGGQRLRAGRWSGWAAWGKHLPGRGTESHRLQAPAALRKWQRHPSTVRLKPRTERGIAMIPASTESKPHPGEGRAERAPRWRTKRQGPEAMMHTRQLSELCVHPRRDARSAE